MPYRFANALIITASFVNSTLPMVMRRQVLIVLISHSTPLYTYSRITIDVMLCHRSEKCANPDLIVEIQCSRSF